VERVSAQAVASLHVYPVKACRGIALRTAVLERRGLQLDRRFLVIDEEARFLTQRAEPRLALVDVAGDPGESREVVLSAPGAPSVRLAPADSGPRRRVTIWKDEVEAADCGDAVATWMSQWLGRPVRVVCMPDDVERAVNPKYSRQGDVVSFADGYPVLIASASSLEDLNARLAEPVPMNRFRPNVVVSGAAPWAEDGWRRVAIGNVVLRIPKPCARCTVTTIDQVTAERGVEPLRTLATFRSHDNDVLFGQNCIPESPGSISVGDAVTVLE
jgi:uncharacterized protein YcbX